MWNKFPNPRDLDRERFQRDLEQPLPQREYVMYFTPRSGSSWVADVVGKTRRLSIPGEAFNPNFLPKMTQSYNAANMEEYCAILRRRRNTKGVFGFQITHHQLAAVFRSEDDFLTRFPSPDCFWLIRKDIVLQAVSLYKMQQTQIAHAPHATPEEILRREALFTYDGKAIRQWLQHILVAEIATEKMFARVGLAPMRMSYEQNIKLRSNQVTYVMEQHLKLPSPKIKPAPSGHDKIATAANENFATRFRADNAAFMQEVEAKRAAMLGKLHSYGPQAGAEIAAPPPDTGATQKEGRSLLHMARNAANMWRR